MKVALALHSVDPEYLPRRLPIIAFEDIGIGDLAVCSEVLQVFGKQRFSPALSEQGRGRMLANVVGRMARATKSRAGCDIFCLANADKEYSAAAAKFARSSETCLVALATDRGAALTSRALALHLLSGMTVHEGRWPRTLSRFNEKALSVVADRLEVPELVARLMVEGRHAAGLAAMLPLVLEAAQTSELRAQVEELPKTKPVLGLPAYAADMYTRVGRSATTEFSTALRERHAQFFDGIPKVRNLPRLIGMAIFHAEGSRLDRRIENVALAGYREQIEEVELRALGWPESEPRQKLYGLIEAEGRLLRTIRRVHMTVAYKRRGD